MANKANYSSLDLFRYVRIEPLHIIDVSLRVKKNRTLSPILKKTKTEQKKWARTFLKSPKAIHSADNLAFPYFDHLTIDCLFAQALPTRKVVKDLDNFPTTELKRDMAYRTDQENLLASMLAYQLLDKQDEFIEVAKLLNFVDIFPRLPQIKTARPYARPLFQRVAFKTVESRNPQDALVDEASSNRRKELNTLAKDLRMLWQARNEMRREQRAKFETALQEIRQRPFTAKPAKTHKKTTKKGQTSSRKSDREAQKERIAFMRKRNEAIKALRQEQTVAEKETILEKVIVMEAEKVAEYVPGKSAEEVAAAQQRVQEMMMQHKVGYGKYCQVYEEVVQTADNTPTSTRPIIDPACFAENPNIEFRDEVRLLGSGNLIKVDQTFLGYKPAEISYIENILPNEMRRREVKSTRYFEQLDETVREETTDLAEETGTKTTQELSSEIESEINTQFNSDINASANASGGGSIGVVDLTGGASLSAGLGIGIDTSLSTSSTTKFSQEIINKAVEKTKKRVLERRLTRSYSLFETADIHEIDNRGNDTSKNGIYVFLDKEVCIRETTYGKRLFMLANIMLPGKNLLCENIVKLRMNHMEVGRKPTFDISPEDIHPHNYRELVGRFKAANVQPPPPPIQTVARTYKTDTTNANVEQQEINFKKVADILVPFFERYKRFLVTDTVTIPEGYQAQEITVTVNHGSNGISIPAHLPFSLAGASIYMAPTLLAAGPYAGLTLPYAFWQLAYLVSPLLHYNADSSNVTVSVNNESYDSPYYFFPPDFLINEIFDLFSNFSVITPDLLGQIQQIGNTLVTELTNSAIAMSGQLGDNMQDIVNTIVSQFTNIFNALLTLLNPANVANTQANFESFGDALSGLSVTVGTTFDQLGETLFEPLQTFLDTAFELINNELTSSLAEVFEFFTTMFANTQNLDFYTVAGMRGDLPVSLNTIAINPGVTVNLTLCAVRTQEALDQWRLDTFSRLYQSYLQQVAEYETRLLTMGDEARSTRSPGMMRQEERTAVKELVLHTLNNLPMYHGNNYDYRRINFFENAIDWNNMSYRLFNYGPNLKQIVLDKLGAYQHIDARRRAFLQAHWAQVLIPVHENPHLEAQVVQYFDNGNFDFEGEFSEEELTALYQDLILGREMLDEIESTTETITIPTDFVMVQDSLPVNDDHDC